MKAKFNKKWMDMKKRFKESKKLIEKIALAKTGQDARSMVLTFKNGIRKKAFDLKPLKPSTIETKKKQNMTKPSIPLYGKGDDKKNNSLINSLRIKKKGMGHRVFPAKEMHWSKKIRLDKLLYIHEHGVIIKKGGGASVLEGKKPKGAIIRIPRRPVFSKAYELTKKGIKNAVVMKDIRIAMREFIRTGSKSKINKMVNSFNKDTVSYV